MLTISSIFAIFLFNVAGVSVTKYINALGRVIASMTKSILVWVLSLIVTVNLGTVYPNFRWEKLDANVIILQTVGFIFVAVGTFIYNDIIKLSILR